MRRNRNESSLERRGPGRHGGHPGGRPVRRECRCGTAPRAAPASRSAATTPGPTRIWARGTHSGRGARWAWAASASPPGSPSWKPSGAGAVSAKSVGGDAAFRVIGGTLLPINVNLLVGGARTTASGAPGLTTLVAGGGVSVSLPTPGISIEPYLSLTNRWHKTSGGVRHGFEFRLDPRREPRLRRRLRSALRLRLAKAHRGRDGRHHRHRCPHRAEGAARDVIDRFTSRV